MRASPLLLAALVCASGLTGGGAEPDHALFTQVLAAHVKDGRVDYAALKGDERLPRYLAQLAATDPAALKNDRERLALWLNAYNAYTLKLIVDRAPAKSITEIHSLGFGPYNEGEILEMTRHGLRAEFFRSLKENGISQISAQNATEAARHGLTGRSIVEARKYGPNLSFEQILKLKRAGVI